MPARTRSETRQRPRLLVVGDAVTASGFATVTHNLCRRLSRDFEIHHLGLGYQGDPHEEKWKIYPADQGGDPAGRKRLEPLVQALRPDVVFLLNDPAVVAGYLEELRTFQPALKVVAFCAVNAAPLDIPFAALAGADRLVTFTEFGRRTLEQAARAEQSRAPRIEVIPPGVDTRTFHPVSRELDPRLCRNQVIRQHIGDRPDYHDAFIVLNANRNQPRKRIDLTIKGFALFARNKPDNVKLHLHMGVVDAGWNVVQLAEREGIRSRLILSTRKPRLVPISRTDLNLAYNASTVGINTCHSEGWGLVSFEHAATGAAQIVPRHTACAELWQGAALQVEPVMTLIAERTLTEMRIVSPEGVAEALERLYEDPKLLADLSEAARRNATRPEYRWSHIAARWKCLFRELLDRPAEAGDSGELASAA